MQLVVALYLEATVANIHCQLYITCCNGGVKVHIVVVTTETGWVQKVNRGQNSRSFA